jgi:hypothetical protein
MRKSIGLGCAFLLATAFAAGAAQFTVTNTNSSGPGSLAQAISDSNALTAINTIVFNIAGSGVHVIDLSKTPLPEITGPVVLDGYTQPGAHSNTLSVGDDAVILIQLDGGLVASGSNGLTISAFNCAVRGLSITGFKQGSSDPFVGPPPGGNGIEVKGSATGNVIEGNFIGVTPDGQTARANYKGVRLDVSPQTIGGLTPAARNVISGNSASGVVVYGSAAGTLIQGNYIGTDASGTRARGNAEGVEVGAVDLAIGGSGAGAANLISGNQYSGIEIGTEYAVHLILHADRTAVIGNWIGTQADGVSPLGNGTGIGIGNSVNCTVGGLNPGAGNIVAFNGRGVIVYSTGERILSNSIYSNGGIGIDLNADGPTPNDAMDPDDGPNHLQNYPVITSTQIVNNSATINGTLNSTPNAQFTIQLFADGRSLSARGQKYLGSTNVTTDASGNASFSVSYPLTDTNVQFNASATSATGDTSEFFLNPGSLKNLSTRAHVLAGDNALIGGFIFTGGNVAVRALGPSLSVNGVPVAGRLADPTLEIYDSTGKLVAANDNWRDDSASASRLQAEGLAPTNDLEAALDKFLGGGAYTVVMRGKNNSTRIGLFEAYFTSAAIQNEEALNLSTRGVVGTGDDVMIGGFIMGDSNGTTRVVIRGIGPSLATSGITNALADPTLDLHDGNGVAIGANDNWRDTQEADIKASGLAPTSDLESAIFATLQPGAYTAIVRGKNDGSGIGLVEVYNLH